MYMLCLIFGRLKFTNQKCEGVTDATISRSAEQNAGRTKLVRVTALIDGPRSLWAACATECACKSRRGRQLTPVKYCRSHIKIGGIFKWNIFIPQLLSGLFSGMRAFTTLANLSFNFNLVCSHFKATTIIHILLVKIFHQFVV